MTEELAAGREIDELVAERVMGHTITSGGSDIVFEHGPGITTGGHADFLRRYSTDIAAAWQVVEKMNQMKPNEFQMLAEHGGYTAEFVEGRSHWGETAPLAICRAALTALEGS